MYWHYKKKQVSIKYSNIKHFKKIKSSPFVWLRHGAFVLRSLVLLSLTISLARPQSGRQEIKQKTEGLDIMLVLDTSGSMKALDFTMNGKRFDRMSVVKDVVGAFIEKRHDDRIGMVVFGTHAFAQAPLTLDHDVLKQYLSEVEIGMAGESTAIGDALGVAVNRIKDIKSKNKIIILLTDGSNTSGNIDPRQLSKAAQVLGIKIYTIGVGSDGWVPIPTEFGYQKVRVDLDEKLLKEIAEKTNAKYFRAKDTEALIDIYDNIDKLEKSEVELKIFNNYEEKYAVFLWSGLFLLFLECILGLTRFRRVP